MFKKALLIVLMGSVAIAQAEVLPYISLSGGLNMLEDIDFDYPPALGGGGGSAEFDTGFVISGAFGLAFESIPVRTEIEISWQKNELDKIKFDGFGSISDDEDQKTSTVMWNGYFDFKSDSALTPYILAGIGAADVDDDIDTLFAYQVGAGLGYALDENIIIDLKYKYFMTEDFDDDDGIYTVDFDGLAVHQVQMGIRYQF
ncbi:MAG TPA: outer membrane beta-barrel protein [Pontiella sp.]|nr:outer membrane beta-barrel protein [Pontiella sp.]